MIRPYRLSPNNDTAFISWEFKYSAQEEASRDIDITKEVPVAGKGKGTAVLNVKDGYLVRADMNFTAPVATVGAVTVAWEEKATFTLKEAKAAKTKK